MTVKPFSYLRDFAELQSWVKGHKWEAPLPSEYLSETGFIAEDAGVNLAACWLICTNAKMAWVGWPVINPRADRAKAREGLDEVFDAISQEASSRGYKYLITTSNIPSLVDRYKKHGFLECDLGVTQLIAKVG